MHWIDPSTLDFLHLVARHVAWVPLLVVLTARPAFAAPWGPQAAITPVVLHRLHRAQSAAMIAEVAGGKPLPAAVLAQVVEQTDGVPLFIEEMTKAVLESGTLQDVNGQSETRGPLAALTIPTTLHDALMARLDRLPTAKGLAQQAAVMGRQFAYAVLHAVTQRDEATLQRELEQLVEAELVYQRGVPPQATYTFKHALIQETAYQSLLTRTRQAYHHRIARVLEAQFPETAETQPELVAHHYTAAGLQAQAAVAWQRAGEHDLQRSAYVEARHHLTTGLEGLTTLPDTPERRQRELDLLIALRLTLGATRGWAAPELEPVITRMRVLCHQLEESPQLFVVLNGLGVFHALRAELSTSQQIAEECLQLAQRYQDTTGCLAAHHAQGQNLYYSGQFVPALSHLKQAIALSPPSSMPPPAPPRARRTMG